METEACIEESNQEGIENKESNRKSQVTTSGSSQAVFVLKDETFVGRVVKDRASHTSNPVGKEDPKANRHSHHHEQEEGVDQIVNDKTTQRGEGKLEHVLVDHEAIPNRSEMGAFVVIDVDRLDGNFHDGEGVACCEEHIHFVLIPLSFNLKHERQEIRSESP